MDHVHSRQVLKFGGTSLADTSRITNVLDVIRSQTKSTVVVVSALAGVTDLLHQLAHSAAGNPQSTDGTLSELERRHASIAADLCGPAGEESAVEEIRTLLRELGELLEGISLLGECSDRTLDRVMSYGELLSAALVSSGLRIGGTPSEILDARELIVTDGRHGGAAVLHDVTVERIRRAMERYRDVIPVVTGFIAATAAGETTTLGRSGSDYTAALVAEALEAEVLEIWTDVDGVMSADPRVVPEAFSLEMLSYEELMELSHFGAEVVYPNSVAPVRRSGIPIRVKNSLNPAFPGTTIADSIAGKPLRPVCGISCIERVALIRLEGDGMQGVPGIAGRLFSALAQGGINVILITQGSSEHSICFAVDPVCVGPAAKLIEAEFKWERQAGLIDDLVVEDDLAVLAVVGDGMRETSGIAGRLFRVVGESGINVRAIAQGSSERNISFVVPGRDRKTAMRAVHRTFFGSASDGVYVFLAGPGRVGSELLRQIAEAQPLVERGQRTSMVLAGLARRRKVLIRDQGVDFDSWHAELAETPATDTATEQLVSAAVNCQAPLRVFVDCTAGESVPRYYDRLLDGGVAVVTANKTGLAGPMTDYRRLVTGRSDRNRIYYEATVGAGLPVVATVHNLVATGDVIARIEGILSGTLSYIFNAMARGRKFSEALREAHSRSMTEPDPRVDLSGMDVARKLVILGREAGWDLELESVAVEPVLPQEPWGGLDQDVFWKQLDRADPYYGEKREAAARNGLELRYVARLEQGNASVGVLELDETHPCFAAGGCDNVVVITTQRYSETPLVIQGPGAGAEVTAAAVFADMMRAARELS